MRGEGSEGDDRPRTIDERLGEEKLGRPLVGRCQIKPDLVAGDVSANEAQQGKIVLDLMRGGARVEHIREQPVVAAVEDSLAPGASLREADDDRGAAACGYRAGTPEIDIAARHDRDIEGAGPVVGQEFPRSTRVAGEERLLPAFVQAYRAVEIATNFRQIENPLQHQRGDPRIGRAAPQVAQERRAQHPVADEVELHDEDVAAFAHIDLAPG